MRNVLLMFFLIGVLDIVSAQMAGSVKGFRWLEGKWHQRGSELYEEWNFSGDSVANGMAYMLSDDGEQVPHEIMQIKYRNGQFYFTALTQKQNNEVPVEFPIVLMKKSMFVAENKQHDYPQRIVYQRAGNSQIKAFIEKLNKSKRSLFSFERVR